MLAQDEEAQAAEMLDGVSEEFLLDANQKIVLEIYMETIEKGIYDFTNEQTETLMGIATQSPLTGGSGVYDARTMLGLELEDDADENLRIDNSDSPIIERSFVIYPNPNDGNMQVDYSLEEGETGVFELFDCMGRKLEAFSLLGGKHTLQLSRKDLQNGVYYGKVTINNEAVYNGKIVIIK